MTDPRAPAFDGDELKEQLKRYDLTPFLDILQEWIENAPSGHAISAMAERNPATWAQSIIGLARLAGFSEKRTLDVNMTGELNVRDLSDAQLERKLLEYGERLGLPMPRTIEATARERKPKGAD